MSEGSAEGIHGILLLNKHQGITSNSVLQKVKGLFGVKKAGHTGTLDPLATGMLPVCLGEATKVCQYILNADKGYEATGLLGIKTNTSDSTGEVVAQVEDFYISEGQLQETLSLFSGSIKQTPSMFSALKHQGKALYHYARAGLEVERKARDIIISTIQLQSFDGKEFQLTLQCSKGTYIRNLVEDIGDALGVGAHMTQLHRTFTSGFENRPMYTLSELSEMALAERLACLIPMDQAVNYLNKLSLTQDEVLALRQGRAIQRPSSSETMELVRLYNQIQQFIGLGERQISGEIRAKRLLAFNSLKPLYKLTSLVKMSSFE